LVTTNAEMLMANNLSKNISNSGHNIVSTPTKVYRPDTLFSI